MKRAFQASLLGLTCLAAAAVAAPVTGLAIIAPQPIPVRVAHADIVIVGKVTKIEDKTVSVVSSPGATNKVEYQIAVVKVEDPILNAKDVKEVRVGFIPATPGVIRPGGYRPPTLTEDEDALLFLTKHFEGDFYVIPAYFDVVKKANNTEYEANIEETKKAAKLLADPTAGLKAKEAADRYLTAAMLVERYRTQKPPYDPNPKEEPIDAAESKLILEALRDAAWAPPAQPKPGIQLTPFSTFNRLGVTPADFDKPPTQGITAELAQAWLKDNAGKFRIKKYVAEKKEEMKDK